MAMEISSHQRDIRVLLQNDLLSFAQKVTNAGIGSERRDAVSNFRRCLSIAVRKGVEIPPGVSEIQRQMESQILRQNKRDAQTRRPPQSGNRKRRSPTGPNQEDILRNAIHDLELLRWQR